MAELKAARPAPVYAYRYKDALYLNITHKCPTACEFCIKFSWDYLYRGNNLLLKTEPTVAQILSHVDDPKKYAEIVFCGYGESTYRLDVMQEIVQELKKRGALKFRMNTIGLGNAINKRDIVPDLARILDSINISLNTADPKHWEKIHRPLPEFRAHGFESVLEFIRAAARAIPATYVTAVELKGTDLVEFETMVKKLGANIRIRPYLDEYEES